MADHYLHLPFARRLRLAEGLHPLAAETLARRPSLVMLGAALAALPGTEQRRMTWFRRLFFGGGAGARWQKMLSGASGAVPEELIVALMLGGDPAVGSMARLAMGLGVLSRSALERYLVAPSGSLSADERASVDRLQARVWLAERVSGGMSVEWQPMFDLVGSTTLERILQHVDRALAAAHGQSPGAAALHRWLKALIAELETSTGAAGSLPPLVRPADEATCGAHVDKTVVLSQVDAAAVAFVAAANRLSEVCTGSLVSEASLRGMFAGDGGLSAAPAAEISARREAWTLWRKSAREEALTRGRNSKVAFSSAEPYSGSAELGLPSITRVIAVADVAGLEDPPVVLATPAEDASVVPEGTATQAEATEPSSPSGPLGPASNDDATEDHVPPRPAATVSLVGTADAAMGVADAAPPASSEADEPMHASSSEASGEAAAPSATPLEQVLGQSGVDALDAQERSSSDEGTATGSETRPDATPAYAGESRSEPSAPDAASDARPALLPPVPSGPEGAPEHETTPWSALVDAAPAGTSDGSVELPPPELASAASGPSAHLSDASVGHDGETPSKAEGGSQGSDAVGTPDGDAQSPERESPDGEATRA